MTRKQLIGTAFAALAAWTPLQLGAATVTEDEAREAAQGWAALREALTGKDRFQGAEIADVKAYEGKDGRGAFYVVSFSGGGFAVTSGDTEIVPVLAYSEDGEFVASDENPLWVMLTADVAGRTKRLANGEQGAGNGTRRLLKAASRSSETSANASTWARLKEAAADATGASLPKRPLLKAALPRTGSIATPIYGPLCEAKWNQYFISGTACYNYYTPSNFLSGCVATAMGQMMRSFEWPKEKTTLLREHSSRFLDDVKTPGVVYTNQWHVGGSYGQSWEYPGPEFGGPYDWENMIANPPAAKSAGTLTEDHCKAIGQLLRDCGITVNMDYHLGGSGADTCAIAAALVQDFGYKNAEYRSDGTDISLEEQLAAYLPSFAMGSPCAVGIPGHAIVADGYGLDSDSRQYVHYNYGGGGSYWYTPPDDKETDVEYPTVKKIVYNIMTPEERYAGYVAGGCFVGGTVLEDDGATPVAGATVTALDAFNGSKVSGATDENGQYVLHLPAGYDYTLSAEVGGDTVSTKKLGMVRSTPGAVGNRRNVRLVAGDIAASAEASLVHRWSFNGTDDANLTDSIGGAVAKVMKKTSNTTTVDGGKVSWADGKAVLSGGNGTGHLNFGEGVMGTGDGATLEVWATKTANPAGWAYLVNYERIDSTTANHLSLALDLGGSNSSWSPSRWGQTENRVAGNKSDGVNVLSPPAGVPFHVTLSLEDKGDGSSDVRWMVSDAATGFIYSKQSINVKNLTLASAAADGWALLLGNNPWTNSMKDLACEIDEVRIWNGVLSDEQIKANIIAGPDNPLGGGSTSVVIPANTTYTVPTLGGYGYMTFSPVTLGEGAKIRFDTTDYFGTGLRFKTGGIFVPSGSVLDYVELSDPENYTAAMEDADTILVRLKGDIAHESTWRGGRPSSAADLANPANWESVNAAGETVSAAPCAKTTVIIPAGALASFTLPGGASPAWGRVIAGGRTATQCGRCGTKPDPRYSAFRVLAPDAYTSLGTLGIDAINGGPNTEWQEANLANAQVRFDGWVHVGADQAGKWDIQTDFDNCSAFAIDGSWVFVNPKWEPDTVTAGCFVSEGWHRFTFIAGDTGRSERGCETTVGESTEENPKVPFSISVNGAEPVAFHTFSFGSDADTIALADDADWTAMGTLDVAPGTTIDLSGHRLKVSGLASDGVGASVTNSVPGAGALMLTGDAASSSVAEGVRLASGVVSISTRVSSGKPDAFVEYVESDGSAYIDSGIIGRSNTRAEMTIQWLSAPDGAFLSSRIDGDNTRFVLCSNDKNGKYYACHRTYDGSGLARNASAPDHVVTEITHDGTRMTLMQAVNGDTGQNTNREEEPIDTNLAMFIFAQNLGGAPALKSQVRCHSLRIWQDGRLVRDFRPCVKDSVAALYDAVSDAVFFPAGGALAAGPETIPAEPEGRSGPFKIMQYNLAYCRYKPEGSDSVVVDPSVAAARIIAENPDFATLNEISYGDGNSGSYGKTCQPAKLGELTGMHWSFGKAFTASNTKNSYGVALLSKEPPLSVRTVPLPRFPKKDANGDVVTDETGATVYVGSEPRVLLVCEFEDFFVATSHFDTQAAHRTENLPAVLAALAGSTKPVFFTGDWNCTPTSAEIASIKEQFTILTPTAGVRTYQNYGASSSIIDYIAVDTAHAQDVYTSNAYVVDDTVTSDHNPVFAEIYLRPAASSLGWIDESFLATGRTGTWSPAIAWDAGSWTANLAGENEFTPGSASGGNVVTIDVAVAFDAVPQEMATPGDSAQCALLIGTNGNFQVWTTDGWVDVAADGVTPRTGTEYSIRFTIDYRSGRHSVAILDGGAYKTLAASGSEAVAAGATSFPLAVSGAKKVSRLRFDGAGLLRSIAGRYAGLEISGFSEDEIVSVNGGDVRLTGGQAEWLNAFGDKTAVADAFAGLSSDEFLKAYLLNLDIMDENALEDCVFEIASINVGEENIEIGIRLIRPRAVKEGGVAKAINGTLRIYGASTLEGLLDPALDAREVKLMPDDFGGGKTEATATIEKTGREVFFNAAIE